MIQRGTLNYKKAQKIANTLVDYAALERRNNNFYFNLHFEEVARFMMKIKELNVFASQIAETVESKMDACGFKLAYISSKQAWILACAAVENEIEL